MAPTGRQAGIQGALTPSEGERLAASFKSVLLEWFGSYEDEQALQPIQASALASQLLEACETVLRSRPSGGSDTKRAA
jgi:hypothetical protein